MEMKSQTPTEGTEDFAKAFLKSFLSDRSKTQTKQYAPGWSVERAAAARSRILEVQPWKYLKGKKTAPGRAKSAMNALKHGRYSRVHQEVQRLIKQLAES